MTQSMTKVGVAALDRHNANVEGDTRSVYDGYVIDTYDPDSDGSGNDFDPRITYGFGRIKLVTVQVADDSQYYARYDYDNNVIRLFNLSDGTEVAGGTDVSTEVRINARGAGG